MHKIRGRERGGVLGGGGGGGCVQDMELMQFGTLKIMLTKQISVEAEIEKVARYYPIIFGL